MSKARLDKRRQERIQWEIVPDAHDSEERAMGWHAYLEDQMHVPFTATCTAQREISPLRKGEVVTVNALASAEECEQEIFVSVSMEERTLAVPLAQLDAMHADRETRQAVADWHYWVEQGCEF